MIEFGTGGFRGVIGDTFTKENIELTAGALAQVMREDGKTGLPVAVGYDRRFMSETAAEWFAERLRGEGINVILSDRATPTPAVMYTVASRGLNYGAMFTASHNPYYFNGIKLFTEGGADADEAFTSRVEGAARALQTCANKSAQRGASIAKDNFLNGYLAFIRTFLSDTLCGNSVNILYDALHGVGAESIFCLAAYYKFKNFTLIHGERDAFFGFSLPNPTEEVMRDIYRENGGGYDFIMATDSDADRLGIVDEKGKAVSNNDILGALYYYLHRYRGMKGAVVKNCATSLLLDKLAEKFGEKCCEVDVGFKNISRKMTETDALLGGESSGGLTVRGYIHGKDSVFSSMLFAEMVVAMKKPVSEIIREVHEFAGYSLCAEERAVGVRSLSDVKEFLGKHTPSLTETVKKAASFGRNYKYELENGWALLRMSGTEPVLRIFAETESESKTQHILNELEDSLKKFA